jgi:hypothetical protein
VLAAHRGIEAFMSAAGWAPRSGPRGRVWVLPAPPGDAPQRAGLEAAAGALSEAARLLRRRAEAGGEGLAPPPDPAAALAAAAAARAAREARAREAAAAVGAGDADWDRQLEAARAAQVGHS